MTTPSRPTAISGRALALFVALTVALGAAFVLGPLALAAIGPGGGFADQPAIINTLRSAFVEYWDSGNPSFPESLERVIDYWSRYHVAKAAIAALLLIVLVALAVRLWNGLRRADEFGPGRKAALASAWFLVVMLALASVVLMAVNTRGAIVPFSSLISMLPLSADDGRLTNAVDEVRQQLGAGGRTSPALGVMVSDFARYHAIMAVLAAIVALVLIGMSLVLWRRFGAAEDRWMRSVLGSLGGLSVLAALVVIVVVATNVGTAADPVPALAAFFNGGS